MVIGGITLLDAARIISMAPDPYSLSSGGVLSLYLDRSGVLWVGSSFGGINKLIPGAGRFENYRHATDDPDGLSGNIMTSVFEEGQGVLWIGTVAGLDRLDRNSGEWKHYRHEPDDPLGLSSNSVEILLD